jgi:hypothetical protein
MHLAAFVGFAAVHAIVDDNVGAFGIRCSAAPAGWTNVHPKVK